MAMVHQEHVTAARKRPLVVTYEDRPGALQGVEVLARSLLLHAPSMTLRVYSPLPAVKDLADAIPNIEYVFTQELVGFGWNVKPTVLLWALDDNDAVIWIDTDIIISGDFKGLCDAVPSGSIAVGQEFSAKAWVGGRIRAEGWKLKIGRPLPYHVNSGSVLVDRSHRALLLRWKECLNSDEYLAYQQIKGARPVAFTGDQDALWALLVSEEFSHLPVHYFRVGSDMLIHCGARGYEISQRLRNVFRSKPAFVHMLGKHKPWDFEQIPDRHANSAAHMHAVCFELSPFHKACEPIASGMNYPRWMERRTATARLLHGAFFGNVALRGMPLALASLIKSPRKG